MNNDLFYKGKFGIERETLRVDRFGRLAQSPHPFGDDEHMTRDFCENQIELITSPRDTVSEAVGELEELDKIVRAELDKRGERIWLYSNPPHFTDESEIPVAAFSGEQAGKRLYREQLSRRYGKRLMLYSGVHFNFSFDERYLREVCTEEDFSAWRDAFYLRLYKQLSIHSWLILLLTAASPIYDLSLDSDGAEGAVRGEYSSMRSSERGYWNEFLPILRFETLSDYVESIREYVEKGVLFSASELYLPIRLKPRGVNHIDNFADGVSHIELRMFDLDPFTKTGVEVRDLEFAHYLIMYLSRQPDFEYTAEMQEQAVIDHQNAALYDVSDITIGDVPILEKAEQILDEMAAFFDDDNVRDILEYQKMKLKNRYCENVRAEDIYGKEVMVCANCSASPRGENRT